MLASFRSWCMKFKGKNESSVYLLVLIVLRASGFEFSIPLNSHRAPDELAGNFSTVLDFY